MEPFTTLNSVVVPLLRDNVDTDAIIPSREMRTVSKKGLASGLFAGWRYLDAAARTSNPDFVLNYPACAGARILLSGSNFGCGSSREHAVWALAEYGFRVVIALSFNPIFHGNCVRNGIVPAIVDEETHALLVAGCRESLGTRLTVDLERRIIAAPDAEHAFEIGEDARRSLIDGLDPIASTLLFDEAIRAFIDIDTPHRPWIYHRS